MARVAARTNTCQDRIGPGVGKARVAGEALQSGRRRGRRGDVALAPAERRAAPRDGHHGARVRAVVVVPESEREEHLARGAVGEAPLPPLDGARRRATTQRRPVRELGQRRDALRVDGPQRVFLGGGAVAARVRFLIKRCGPLLAGAPVGGELFRVGGGAWIRVSCHGAACSGVLSRSLEAHSSARYGYGGVFPIPLPTVRPRSAL